MMRRWQFGALAGVSASLLLAGGFLLGRSSAPDRPPAARWTASIAVRELAPLPPTPARATGTKALPARTARDRFGAADRSAPSSRVAAPSPKPSEEKADAPRRPRPRPKARTSPSVERRVASRPAAPTRRETRRDAEDSPRPRRVRTNVASSRPKIRTKLAADAPKARTRSASAPPEIRTATPSDAPMIRVAKRTRRIREERVRTRRSIEPEGRRVESETIRVVRRSGSPDSPASAWERYEETRSERTSRPDGRRTVTRRTTTSAWERYERIRHSRR